MRVWLVDRLGEVSMTLSLILLDFTLPDPAICLNVNF